MKRLSLCILHEKPTHEKLLQAKISYQIAQFYHLQAHSDTTWFEELENVREHTSFREKEEKLKKRHDAIIVFDEYTLLNHPAVQSTKWDTEAPFIFITHDFWCHPIKVSQFLKQQKNPLMILRHHSAINLFNFIAPEIPKVLQTPGVETEIFKPRKSQEYDIILSGSESDDYPMRQRLNNLVRTHKDDKKWKVLDLTQKGLTSNPQATQLKYSESLAKAKVSVTATNRGGSPNASIALQYFDPSPARFAMKDDFYGLSNPEIGIIKIPTAGITPRYLESFASKSLLIGDLPDCDNQKWYSDKMVILSEKMYDDEIVNLINNWVINDIERNALCQKAYNATLNSQTSMHKAKELTEIIRKHLENKDER